MDPVISLKEEYQVRYWMQALGVTKEELVAAIEQVGHGSEVVRKYLESRRIAAHP
jgi:hypothetical protein